MSPEHTKAPTTSRASPTPPQAAAHGRRGGGGHHEPRNDDPRWPDANGSSTAGELSHEQQLQQQAKLTCESRPHGIQPADADVGIQT